MKYLPNYSFNLVDVSVNRRRIEKGIEKDSTLKKSRDICERYMEVGKPMKEIRSMIWKGKKIP